MDCPVHQQFRVSVAKISDTLAVEAWDGAITYGELDSISSHVAVHPERDSIETAD